jgi:hypothetical protein
MYRLAYYDDAVRQPPDRVIMRGRDHRSQRSEIGENQSRKGPDESSPVRSAGLAYFKRRPSRRDDRWFLVILKSPRDQEPNVSIVPCACGTDISFLHHFPALRTGLLSLSPSLLRPAAASPWRGLRVAGAPQLEERRRPPGYGGQAGTSLQRILLSPYVDAHVAAAGRRCILQEVS